MAHHGDIKFTEAEIQKRSAKLEQEVPLAEEASKRKQTFIQNISRQFATPLNIIEGLTSVLVGNIANRQNGKTALRQKSSEDIDQIKTMLQHHATQLLNSTIMLFDSSDLGTADPTRYLKKDTVACNELVREAIENVQKRFYMAPIQFETELPDSTTIKTNRLYLIRTIKELLNNAAKYSDRQHISLYLSQTDTAIRFVIEDVGPGLPKDFNEFLFTSFTKVDDSSEGLGLGLPLCKRHIAGLGGNLTYDESYKQGCRFIWELPNTP